MQKTDWIWFDGKQVPWDEATIHVSAHSLHYGGGAFEGIRFYKTERGPAIFRLHDHVKRLIYSCQAIDLNLPFSLEEIEQAIIDTVKINKLEEGYIRPLAFWGAGDLRIAAQDLPVHLKVAAWPMGQYLTHSNVDVKVSPYIRIHPRSTVADAKICGHYVNSIMSSIALKNTKYHESLLLDHQGNIAEGPGENFFCVVNGVFKTPSLGNILAGITRDTILQMCRDLDIECHAMLITLEEALNATEAFFSGTAAEITPIHSLNDKVFGDGETGEITQRIKSYYFDIIRGKVDQYEHYLTYID